METLNPKPARHPYITYWGERALPERVNEALQVLLGCKICQPVLNWSLPSRLSQTCICHDALTIDIYY